MPIIVTVTNSGKISLQEFVRKILVFTSAASRLNSKVFQLGLSRIIFVTHKKLKIEYGFNMRSRLQAIRSTKKMMYFSIIMLERGRYL